MQNIPLVTDGIRNTNLGTEPRTLSVIEPLYPEIYRTIRGSRFYDYIRDRIVDGQALADGTIVMGVGALAVSRLRLEDPNALVILKGIPTRGAGDRIIGGEFLPLIGTLANQKIVIEALIAARKISGGELVPMINVMERISEGDRRTATEALQSPIYENASIQSILKSHTIATTGPAEIEKSIAKIRSALSKPIPPDKAIHVTSGQLVEVTKGRYHITEYTVRVPGATPDVSTEKTVKFAFKSTMKEDERRAYERMLVERFQARPAQAGAPAPDRRAAITLAPIVATSIDAYQSIFPRESQSIIPYLRTLHASVAAAEPSRSQSLHELEQAPEISEEGEEFNPDDF